MSILGMHGDTPACGVLLAGQPIKRLDGYTLMALAAHTLKRSHSSHPQCHGPVTVRVETSSSARLNYGGATCLTSDGKFGT
jgi:hypothetical protein